MTNSTILDTVFNTRCVKYKQKCLINCTDKSIPLDIVFAEIYKTRCTNFIKCLIMRHKYSRFVGYDIGKCVIKSVYTVYILPLKYTTQTLTLLPPNKSYPHYQQSYPQLFKVIHIVIHNFLLIH